MNNIVVLPTNETIALAKADRLEILTRIPDTDAKVRKKHKYPVAETIYYEDIRYLVEPKSQLIELNEEDQWLYARDWVQQATDQEFAEIAMKLIKTKKYDTDSDMPRCLQQIFVEKYHEARQNKTYGVLGDDIKKIYRVPPMIVATSSIDDAGYGLYTIFPRKRGELLWFFTGNMLRTGRNLGDLAKMYRKVARDHNIDGKALVSYAKANGIKSLQQYNDIEVWFDPIRVRHGVGGRDQP